MVIKNPKTSIQRDLRELWIEVENHYLEKESTVLNTLINSISITNEKRSEIQKKAKELVTEIRGDKTSVQFFDAIMLEYGLDNNEGILLMCLSESLLRIPDTETIDLFIKDKFSSANWKKHLKQSKSIFVNASTRGLNLSGKLVFLDASLTENPYLKVNKLVEKLSEPILRKILFQVIKFMGKQFVLSENIDDILNDKVKIDKDNHTYSFDMLGEAAVTADDSESFFDSYLHGIKTTSLISKKLKKENLANISIKLSALYPRYEGVKKEEVLEYLYQKVVLLVKEAKQHDIGITIDAEEASRLELSLLLFEQIYTSNLCKNWGKFGLVVQAYSKRALPVLKWLNKLSHEQETIIPVRLVKGAYWDYEIKNAQQLGLNEYPVFTLKESTDLSYMACSSFLLSDECQKFMYPQFATHNAYTLCMIESIGYKKNYELQKLFGMGDVLYNHVRMINKKPVRIYAPIGSYENLLPYLVRRLLENGANSSFIHQLLDDSYAINEVVKDPLKYLIDSGLKSNPKIDLPQNIFRPYRDNSSGVDINNLSSQMKLQQNVVPYLSCYFNASSIVVGKCLESNNRVEIKSPYDPEKIIGKVAWSNEDDVNVAFKSAVNFKESWIQTPIKTKSKMASDLANLIEENKYELIALNIMEAGKTFNDSIDEIREAIDFCRFYASEVMQMEQEFPTLFNDKITYKYQGKGICVCISPWNFPIAIFIGQIVAALVTGNCVIAKPAPQTSVIAFKLGKLILEAGFPEHAFHLLLGDGVSLGNKIIEQNNIDQIVFTGSTQTALHIRDKIAQVETNMIDIIAETGGLNVMVVDSTALLEQAAIDIIHSAFYSAGQRCSALRVLYIQEDIYQKLIDLIIGATMLLKVGSPEQMNTDIGPVIDKQAQNMLLTHIERMKKLGKIIYEQEQFNNEGQFVYPTIVKLDSINELTHEIFGPVLHVISYKPNSLGHIIEDINNQGYGLTLGIQTRNHILANYLEKNIKVGNTYINRNQVGAVVESQPFGGMGKSGTGPKAGGPLYLKELSKKNINL